MKRNILLLLTLICHSVLIGQTIHFSQFYNAAAMINPANTGNFDGDWRVNNIFRSQGNNLGEPYTTTMISFDKHFYYYSQQISGGAYFINDYSANNSLMVNKFYLTSGYQIKISENNLLLYGLQVGIVQERTTLNESTFPDQFDMSTGHFNPSLPNNEIFNGDNTLYADLATGISWQYNKPTFRIETGGAVFQINQPKESFLGTDQNLPRKYVLHGSFTKIMESNFYFNPQLYASWLNNISEILYGINFGYDLAQKNKLSTIYTAFYIRNGFDQNYDSAIFVFGFDYDNWNYCVSYDYDISGLRIASSRSNAFELSVTYTRPSTRIKKSTIPCERY